MLTFGTDALIVSVLPELGGRISRIVFEGEDLLSPRPDDLSEVDDFNWGSFVMAPWCNREPAGEYEAFGKRPRYEANAPDGTAIHGLVHNRPWTVMPGGRTLAVHDTTFPWPFSVTASIQVVDNTLSYRLVLTNDAEDPMPAGLGWHPWFTTKSGPLLVHVSARREYTFDDNYVPTDHSHAVMAPTGLHAPMSGSHRLYTDLTEQTVSLVWPTTRIHATLQAIGPADHILVYATDELHAIAVEPQTHAPGGLRRTLEGLPGALRLVVPRATLEVQYLLTIDRA